MSTKSSSSRDMVIPIFGPLPKHVPGDLPRNSIGTIKRKRGPAGRETTHPITTAFPNRTTPQTGTSVCFGGQTGLNASQT